MPPAPENPYPISDQNIRFSVPYFRPYSQNVYPISDPVMCGKFGNSEWICGERDVRDAPNDVRVFFFAINVYGNTRYSKSGIPDQTDGIYSLPISDKNGKIYTLFQTRNARKWYPLGRHIPIWLIYGSSGELTRLGAGGREIAPWLAPNHSTGAR